LDAQRFDIFTKQLSLQRTPLGSRRAILAGVSAGLLSRLGIASLDAESRRNRGKKKRRRKKSRKRVAYGGDRAVQSEANAAGLTFEVLQGSARTALIQRSDKDGGDSAINRFILESTPADIYSGPDSPALRVYRNGQHIHDLMISGWESSADPNRFAIAIYGEGSSGETWRSGLITYNGRVTDVLVAIPTSKKKKKKRKKKGKKVKVWSVSSTSVAAQATSAAGVRTEEGTDRCSNCTGTCQGFVNIALVLHSVKNAAKDYKKYVAPVIAAVCPGSGQSMIACVAEVAATFAGLLDAIERNVFDPFKEGVCRVWCGAGGQCEACTPKQCGVNQYWEQMDCACRCAFSPGIQSCAGGCVDTRSDRNHCGGCGRVCSPGQSCVNSQCIADSGCRSLGQPCSGNTQCCQSIGDTFGLTGCGPTTNSQGSVCCRSALAPCQDDTECCSPLTGLNMYCFDGICKQRCGSNEYLAEYWNNNSLSGSPSLVRCESWPINHRWAGGSPGAGIPSNNFSARWTGRAQIAAGAYDFIARGDDGIRVWLNNASIIDRWSGALPTTLVTRQLSAGQYNVKVEFREFAGDAIAQFRWDPHLGGICGAATCNGQSVNTCSAKHSCGRCNSSCCEACDCVNGHCCIHVFGCGLVCCPDDKDRVTGSCECV
jgi:hypothetical protein